MLSGVPAEMLGGVLTEMLESDPAEMLGGIVSDSGR